MIYIVIALIALLAASAAALLVCLTRLGRTQDQLRDSLALSERRTAELDAARREILSARQDTARAEARCDAAMERVEAMRRQYEADEARFRRMSAEALQMQGDRMATRSEGRLAELLTPLREDIERFRASVTDCYSAEARERFALREALTGLIDQTRSIGTEARQLANALRGNSKTQGDWGEMILRTLLEKSGLREGEEFAVQQTRDSEGRIMRSPDGGMLRPDVVVYFPENRAVVIDSKVSLTAFTEWVNADDSTPESRVAREAAGRRHVESVRKHIAELYTKSYQDRIGGRSLDFVLLFIPNEAAYMAAMSLSDTIWQEAYDKRVLIVSPTHLISVLRLTSQLWSHERQTANAVRIAQDAGRMYDKLVGFVEDMERIGRGLRQTSAALTDAMKKLSSGTGNLIGRAEALRQLGIKASRRLPSDFGRFTDDSPSADRADGDGQKISGS